MFTVGIDYGANSARALVVRCAENVHIASPWRARTSDMEVDGQ